MKKLYLKDKRILFAAASVILMLLALFGMKQSLTSSAPYIPEDTVSAMDNERSQVYVSGKDYKLDIQTQEKHKEQQQKRSKILEEEEESHQQTESQKRATSTRGEQRRDEQGKPVYKPPVQQGKPVKKPPKKEEESKPPEEPEDPKGEEEEDEPADKENKKPVITTSLIDGRKMKGSAVSFWVTVTDYKNQNVPVFSNGDGHFEVYVNGTKITSTGTSGKKTNFRADVKDGANKIKITATDSRKKTATRIINIRCDTSEEDKPIGSVTVSASAPSLGIGTIFSGIKVDITEQEPLNEVLSAAFKKAGYSAEMSKSYLAAIKKNGIAKNATITDELRERALEKRVTLYEREDWPKGWQNRLKEKDFCSSSGWTYYVNGSMPGVGIGAYIPDDGDEISLVFSLFDGDMG